MNYQDSERLNLVLLTEIPTTQALSVSQVIRVDTKFTNKVKSILFNDNFSPQKLITNLVFNKRIKYIDVPYHLLWIAHRNYERLICSMCRSKTCQLISWRNPSQNRNMKATKLNFWAYPGCEGGWDIHNVSRKSIGDAGGAIHTAFVETSGC